MGTYREIELGSSFSRARHHDVAYTARMEREKEGELARVGEHQERRESNLSTPTFPGEGERENVRGRRYP